LSQNLGRQTCTGEVTDSITRADFVLVATPDSVLPEMGRMLARSGCLRPRQVVFHLSGLYDSHILGDSLGPEIHSGSIHPVQAVASIEAGVRLLQQSDFTVEGDEAAVEMGCNLVKSMGGKPVRISPDMKPLYHCALAVASNFMVLLGWLSWELLRKTGVEDTYSRTLFLGLMSGTLSNLKGMVPEEALTGPVLRGDWQTVEKHIQALEADFPDALNFYKKGSALLLQIARARGEAPAKALDRIESMVKDLSRRAEGCDDV